MIHASKRQSVWRWGNMVLLLGGLYSAPLQAECRVDNSFGAATHFLVNGLINKPEPEAVFDVQGDQVGAGNLLLTTTVNNKGGNKTLANHMRFRLRVKSSSSGGVTMYADSSAGLSCVNCAGSVSIPFSKIGWTVGSASETRGSQPASAYFNNGTQTWITGNRNTDSVFNLQFNFMNDTIYPAGTYKGTFQTRGVPH